MTITKSLLSSNKNLRKTLRRQRLALALRQRRYDALQARRQLSHLPLPLSAKTKLTKHKHRPYRIGIFVDAFGELPTQPLIDWAYQHGFAVYLPVVIAADKPLQFVKINALHLQRLRMTKHPLGMRQPIKGQRINASQLDLLFMPLVALDKQGNRMGMGGGFYDKTLSRRQNSPLKKAPIKIGWGYDFQLVEQLDSMPWDIKLDMAVLPSQCLVFRRYLTQSK